MAVLPTHDMKELRMNGNFTVQMLVNIDAKSVFEGIRATVARLPSEQSLVGHLLWVREMLQLGVCKCLRWVDTRDMAADGMTKGSIDREALIMACQQGLWKIVGAAPQCKSLRDAGEHQDSAQDGTQDKGSYRPSPGGSSHVTAC